MGRVLLALSLMAVLGAVAWSQATDDSKPATSNLPGAEYPRVHADLRVTFRISAPNAQKVQVVPGGSDNGLGQGPFDMQRDDKGVWTVTIPPAVPGFHYYWLLVDGFACNDPATGSVLATVDIAHEGGHRTLTTPTYKVDIALRVKRI